MTRKLALAVGTLALVGALLPSVTSRPVSTASISGFSEPEAVVGAATATTSGSLYTFSSTMSGKPIRWNPCAAIHWQFRAAGAPAGGRTVVTQAVARIAQATGTRWVFDGVVTTAPTSAWLPRSTSTIRPVLIGWTSPWHSDLLAGRPASVLGVTRTAWFGRTSNGVTVAAIRAAVIALDNTDRLPATGPVSWKTVTLHELGHVMGLGHAGSSRQVMYPMLQRTLSDLQSGDLQGLAKVGRPAGCISV